MTIFVLISIFLKQIDEANVLEIIHAAKQR